ncbi:MAG: hypothetical protein QHH07_02385 [Sedimentisphaerales bacterium]|nr:hypothetical protein [Sedimentisphaerales bacterium]
MKNRDQANLRQYSGLEVLLHNLPYILMVCLGGTVLWRWPGRWWAIGYLCYGLIGALWTMLFVCPYCRFWGTRSCPCGYGLIAATLRQRADCLAFQQQFRRHIPVIVPLWLIPLVPLLLGVWRGIDPVTTILTIAFSVDGFLILPLVSRRCGCKDCPQKAACPWMRRLETRPTCTLE